MGLDMYLTGSKYLPSFENVQTEDGFRLKERRLELGYWRKHPNLHGYIVNTFNQGVDDCHEIELCKADIENIIDTVKKEKLPNTEGFFFGKTDGSEKKETLEILNGALKWMKEETESEWRSVIYQASW